MNSASALQNPHAASSGAPSTPGAGHSANPEGSAHSGHAPAADETAKAGHAEAEPAKYALPFAWEVSGDEPLAKTRDFLREAFADNKTYMSRGPAAFKPFAEKQTPRATVVSCSDSRVQHGAWDATPENDNFTIRNIGNQLVHAHGSVLYGVDHLATPLLLIVGHTGCGAVKAAMGKLDDLHEPLRRELSTLKVPAAEEVDRAAWAQAVITNVHNQVDYAVEHFAKSMQEGNLTVVGAVYDFRNDLRGGAGKLHVVNVNANREPERLEAFSKAIEESTPSLPPSSKKRLAKRSAPRGNLADFLSGLSPVAPID